MDVWERNLSQKVWDGKETILVWGHGKVDEDMQVTTFDIWKPSKCFLALKAEPFGKQLVTRANLKDNMLGHIYGET